MTHAWCSDPSRDAAVRAAEDGRTGPLPTLGEAIARPFAEAAERSSLVSKTGEGQSGMRTERITLEVTGAPGWRVHVNGIDVESVRVVEQARNVTPREGSCDAQAASGGGVIRDMTDILRGNTADADEKHAAMATLVEAVFPGWVMKQAASGGGKPVAWMCEWTDHTSLYDSRTQAEIDSGGDIVPQPLYRQPPGPEGDG
jgi:hypothetical protein